MSFINAKVFMLGVLESHSDLFISIAELICTEFKMYIELNIFFFTTYYCLL